MVPKSSPSPKPRPGSLEQQMMYGVVSCPRKGGNSIAFGKCQNNRDDLCSDCQFNAVKWFPSKADLSATYKKTCRKAGHKAMVVLVCKECSAAVGSVALFALGCFEKEHTPQPQERCETCAS